MRNIDADNITQAVIARHAVASDARLREVMTSLVQHLHAFAREVQLSESEWAGGLRFLTECGRISSDERQEVVLLSDALGLSMLATALNHRKPTGCTESTLPGPFPIDGAAQREPGDDIGHGAGGEACYVRGSVRALDGTPVAGAEVQVWHAHADGRRDTQPTGARGPCTRGVLVSDAGGDFQFKCVVPEPCAIAHDGPVGHMLQALGRHPWRPAHLHFMITAPGFERLVTQVYRKGDQYLDADAVFGVRSSLVADWVRHDAGRTPDGQTSAVPFTTLDFTFVLNPTTGEKP